jgi:poly(A) polymerase
VSADALKVLYRLHRSGYLAYLVGGSVRDLLLGHRPKDFDVATNARPQEIRRLFRNSRIIGRRFRLAHVFFRDTIIEVATFRANPEPPEDPDEWREGAAEAAEEEGSPDPPLPRREEVAYGTPAEDARRRDFTVNALFYDIADFSVIDYVGGIEDLDRGIIRTIGDPDRRFLEDPVRMLRALEYSARLGFAIDPPTAEAIARQNSLITEASSSRLTYELLECLRSGHAAGIHEAWRRAGLFSLAFPDLPLDTDDSVKVLETVDATISNGVALTDASVLGAFFLPRFFTIVAEETDTGGRLDNAEVLSRTRSILAPAGTSMHLSNQTLHLMHQGLFTLTKMRQPPERGRQVVKLSRQDYFQVAWELHGLAADLGLLTAEAHRGWDRAVRRLERGQQPVDEQPVRRRPRRRRRRRKTK